MDEMKGKRRRWRTSKETSSEACECTVTSGVLKGNMKNGVAVRKEDQNNRETYAIRPSNGIDRECMFGFRHGRVMRDQLNWHEWQANISHSHYLRGSAWSLARFRASL